MEDTNMTDVFKRRNHWLQERNTRSDYLESLREMNVQAHRDALANMQGPGLEVTDYEEVTLRELFRLDELLNAAEKAFRKWEVATRP
jgi:hypothetical protein